MMDKVRVHEIAKELGITSKEVVDKAKQAGFNLKTASTTVTMSEAEAIMKYIMMGELNNDLIEKQRQFANKQQFAKINISLSDLKSIKTLEWSFSFSRGIQAIIAENGSGKSSLIISLAKLVFPNIFTIEFVGKGYENTLIKYVLDEDIYTWEKDPNWSLRDRPSSEMPTIKGFFESSILSGTRFKKIDQFSQELDVDETSDDVFPANAFIRDNMNYILYGDSNNRKFSNLMYIRAIRKRKFQEKFKDIEYKFYAFKKGNTFVKEYFFSTGEYFLLSLLKFIYGFRHNGSKYLGLIIIDEIELSLHPFAQKRLMDKLKIFAKEYNLLFVFATHSLQIIQSIEPDNIHYLENDAGICSVQNPIYPNYLSSRLFAHNSYDFILLVEDDLAKKFVGNMLNDKIIDMNKSFMILPIGGWQKVCELYMTHQNFKIFGSAQTIVILDGDIELKSKDERKPCKHCNTRFLPFKNVESLVVDYLKEKQTSFFPFVQKQIFPKTFNDLELDFTISKTDDIKNIYKKFISNTSRFQSVHEDIITNAVIDKIIKINYEEVKFQKFKLSICEFLNLE